MSLSSNKVHAVLMCPVVNLELFAQWYVGEDNNLFIMSLPVALLTYKRTWKPLIKSTVIS